MVGTKLSHRLVGKICVLHGPVTSTYQQQLLLSRPELASNIWPSIKVSSLSAAFGHCFLLFSTLLRCNWCFGGSVWLGNRHKLATRDIIWDSNPGLYRNIVVYVFGFGLSNFNRQKRPERHQKINMTVQLFVQIISFFWIQIQFSV